MALMAGSGCLPVVCRWRWHHVLLLTHAQSTALLASRSFFLLRALLLLALLAGQAGLCFARLFQARQRQARPPGRCGGEPPFSREKPSLKKLARSRQARSPAPCSPRQGQEAQKKVCFSSIMRVILAQRPC